MDEGQDHGIRPEVYIGVTCTEAKAMTTPKNRSKATNPQSVFRRYHLRDGVSSMRGKDQYCIEELLPIAVSDLHRR